MARLRVLTALDVATGLLDGASFIPAAEAMFAEDCNVEYADMTANQQTLAKASMIAYCAALVVASAPTEKIDGINAAITPIPAGDKVKMHDLLMAEYETYLKKCSSARSWINCSITTDYTGRDELSS
jgi:hypothetical protein